MNRMTLSFSLLGVVSLICLCGCLLSGSASIPVEGVWGALAGRSDVPEAWRVIVLESRMPMALTALLTGAALAVAGLLLQTIFDNPLAGPSILGVSTGASLGVAVAVLGAGVTLGIVAVCGALAGAAVVLGLLLVFSRVVRSTAMLLIVGIMVGYFASSAISLLNYFAGREGAVQAYVIWGLGSFSGVGREALGVFGVPILVALCASMLFVKPLDAMLLGERYAQSMGVNPGRVRGWLLTASGVLTALVTAYCGPIGFIGLVVPHVARMITGTSRHAILLPATMLAGAATALLTAWLSVLPVRGILPVNAITPVIGVPVIIYIILRRRRLHYFN